MACRWRLAAWLAAILAERGRIARTAPLSDGLLSGLGLRCQRITSGSCTHSLYCTWVASREEDAGGSGSLGNCHKVGTNRPSKIETSIRKWSLITYENVRINYSGIHPPTRYCCLTRTEP